MTDDRFEEFLRESARGYRTPPETPRDAMWAQIESARAGRRGVPVSRWWTGPWLRSAAAVAALLAIGFGLGRWTMREPAVVTASAEPTDDGSESEVVYRVAAADHFEDADAFISLFRAEARSGRADAEVAAWAGDLLETTRLMMDSPAGDDANLRGLLEDLELVLAQITQYASRRNDGELQLIEEGLDERNVLLRLRAVVADPNMMVAQGAM